MDTTMLALPRSKPPGRDAAPVTCVPEALTASAVRAIPPAGHLRVVDAVRSGRAGRPYLDARARVVRVGTGALGSHHAVVPELGALPVGDTDLLLWDGQGDPTEVAARLAPGGVVVAPTGVTAGLARIGLRIEPATGVVVARDPRPRPAIAPALAELDRTMCVDRARVLAALVRAGWIAPAGDSSRDAHDLLAALTDQLRVGEPDVRTLPWPAARAETDRPSRGPAGCDVLAVMPHPDDETIYAGGTIAGLSRAGATVHLVVATDGAGGRGGTALGARRAAELLEACSVLGIRAASCLAWPDTGKYRDRARSQPATAADALDAWGLQRAMGDLVAAIRRHRPRTLLSLGPEVDPNLSLHGHHLAVGLLAAVAFHLAAEPSFRSELGPAWTVETHRVVASSHQPADDHTSSLVIDPAIKRQALEAHRTQAYSTRGLIERLTAGRDIVEHTRHVQGLRSTPWIAATPGPDTSPAFHSPPQGWAARARAVTQVPRDREAIVELLTRQTAVLPEDSARAASLATLARPDGVAVVTGQQVGMLGGPAYTLVKALAAVELARRVSAGGVPTVPVFWMATQDHDLDEVATVPTLDGPSVRVPIDGRGAPVGGLRLPADLTPTHDAWLSGLPASVRPAAEAELTDRPGATLAEAFAERLARLTAGTGLLILDPSDPAFARLAAPVIARELEAPGRDRLRSAPGPQVVPVVRDATEVFVTDDDGRRRRVLAPTPSLLNLLREQPQRFSAAALLRPVVQDAVLPAIATVAGPTEARYLRQMQPLYAGTGVVPSVIVRRPIIQPRLGADLRSVGDVDTSLADLGERGLPELARAWLQRCEALDRQLLEQPSASVLPVWTALRDGADAALDGLRTAAAWPGHRDAIEASLAEGAFSAAARRLYRLKRSLRRDGRRRIPAAIAARRRLAGGAERRLSVAELRARFGPDIVPALSAAFASLGTRELILTGGTT